MSEKDKIVSLNFNIGDVLLFFLVLIVLVGIYYLTNVYLFLVFCIALSVLISLVSLKKSLLFMIFLNFLHGLRCDIYGEITIRPDHIGIVTVSILFLMYYIAGRIKIYKTPLDLPIFLFLLLNLFSSIFFSPIKEVSLRKCLLLFIYSLFYFVPVNLFHNYYKSEEKSKEIIRTFLDAGISMMLFGLLGLGVFLVFRYNIGGGSVDLASEFVPVAVDVSIYRIFSTTQEPNIFGNISSTLSLFFIGFLFSNIPLASNEKSLLTFFSIIAILSTIFSYTRGAWIALLVGVGLYILFRRFLNIRLTKGISISFGCIVVLLVISGIVFLLKEEMFLGYIEKFKRLIDYKTGTGQARVWMWNIVLKDIPSSLIFGHGTQAHLTLFEGGEKVGIANFLLDVLHSSGIVGLLVFLWIQLKIIFITFKGIRSSTSPFLRQVLRIFLVSFLGMWMSYMFTSAYWLSFPWLFTAIIIAYNKIAVVKHRMR